MIRIKTHPGEILRDDFLVPPAIDRFCRQMGEYYGVSGGEVAELIAGGASVDNKMAKALAHYFETTPDFWLNLQHAHDDSIKKSLEQNEP